MNHLYFPLLLAVGFSLLSKFSLLAQVENVPIDIQQIQTVVGSPNWTCETISVLPPNVDSLKKEDANLALSGELPRIAQVMPVSVSSLNSGSWNTNNGINYWSLKVRSVGAQNLYLFSTTSSCRKGKGYTSLTKINRG